MHAAPASSCPRPTRMGRPSKEDNAMVELRVLYAEIGEAVLKCGPSLDRLEAATYALGPAAHQHILVIRYQLERLERRPFPKLS